MQRRDNLTHLILANVVVFVLTPLMIAVAAQAQITFMSNRDGHVHPRLGWTTFEIYVMEVDGNNQRRLTNNPNLDTHPSWSPDGKRIAFASNRDGNRDGNRENYEIYVMDADGNNQQRLTDNDFYDTHPSWSPDGERIAFISRRDGHFIGEFGLTSEIYVMDADGKNTRRLTNNRKSDSSPSWSPDGKWIIFASDRKGDDVNYEIYVMDTDGGNQRRLTNNRVHDTSPSWSSDGKRIVFSSYRDGNAEIYVMDNDGENQQKLTNNPGNDFGPAWFGPAFVVSPAGKKFTTWGWLKQVDR